VLKQHTLCRRVEGDIAHVFCRALLYEFSTTYVPNNLAIDLWTGDGEVEGGISGCHATHMQGLPLVEAALFVAGCRLPPRIVDRAWAIDGSSRVSVRLAEGVRFRISVPKHRLTFNPLHHFEHSTWLMHAEFGSRFRKCFSCRPAHLFPLCRRCQYSLLQAEPGQGWPGDISDAGRGGKKGPLTGGGRGRSPGDVLWYREGN